MSQQFFFLGLWRFPHVTHSSASRRQNSFFFLKKKKTSPRDCRVRFYRGISGISDHCLKPKSSVGTFKNSDSQTQPDKNVVHSSRFRQLLMMLMILDSNTSSV